MPWVRAESAGESLLSVGWSQAYAADGTGGFDSAGREARPEREGSLRSLPDQHRGHRDRLDAHESGRKADPL
jgi:hypothetical protein